MFFSQDLIYALFIVWIIFAFFALSRYFFAVQEGKTYIKTIRKKLFGDLALSLIALGFGIALVKIFGELFGKG